MSSFSGHRPPGRQVIGVGRRGEELSLRSVPAANEVSACPFVLEVCGWRQQRTNRVFALDRGQLVDIRYFPTVPGAFAPNARWVGALRLTFG